MPENKISTYIKVKNATNGFDTLFPITKAENIIVDEMTDKRLNTKLAEMDVEIAAKVNATEKGMPLGIATLDANGLVPLSQLPAGVKEVRVVDNILARDAISEKFMGLSVFVKDATIDPSVSSGGAYYIWDGETFVKTAEAESMDVVVQWMNIHGKPTTLAGFGITDGVNISEVTNVAVPNKILRLDEDGLLPTSITGDAEGNAATASKLQFGRTITIAGDVDGEAVFDGSKDITINVVANDKVAAGTYTKVTVDTKGRVTAGTTLTASDIPALDWTKITTGKPTTLAGYGITDGVNKHGDTMTGFLTLHADPTHAMHAVTKQYVDAAVQGLDIKKSVRVATTENIALIGLQVIDGAQLVEGNRVLVKDQINKVENGIWIAHANAWTRAEDFDDDPDTNTNEVEGGEFVFVEEGNVNADMGFVVVTNAPLTVGEHEIEFTQFSGAGQVIAGIGLAKSGNTIYLTNTGVVAGTYTKVVVDSQGRITAGAGLVASDIPELDWSKITTGKPTSSVTDIDDAVARRHTHANAAVLDKLTEGSGSRLVYNGRDVAFKDEANTTSIGTVEPDLPVYGIWFQTV